MSVYLVTGGAGFIGSHIVEELVKRKQEVVVLDNFTTGKKENLKPFLGKINVIKGDIRNLSLVRKVLKNVDYVLHQAALRSVPKSVDKPREYHEVNVSGTLNILLASKENGVKKVVFASSSSVYGLVKTLPVKETLRPDPISPYGASKLAGEYYCRVFSRIYNFPTIILRYFNVFGPRQSLESKYAVVIPKLITCMLKDKSPPVHGDGKQSRDFTYVQNVVNVNFLAIRAKNIDGEIFNVANGKRYTVLELVKYLNIILGKDIKPEYTPPRVGDVRHTQADISNVKNLLGYKPSFDFEEGLRKTIKYFKDLK